MVGFCVSGRNLFSSCHCEACYDEAIQKIEYIVTLNRLLRCARSDVKIADNGF